MIRRILPALLLFSATLAAGKPKPAEPLDQTAVHAEYENGDFDTVLKLIEAFQKRNPRHSREDSVFIARHLAVVYAANPKTVEVGKYWMYRMLTVMPSADLAGMYVNEDIDRIFDKVRREYLARQSAAGVDISKLVPPYPDGNALGGNPDQGTGKGARRAWLWIGGGTVLAATIITLVAVAAESDGPDKVPVDL